MRIETNLIDRKGQNFRDLPKEKKSNGNNNNKSKKGRRRQKKPTESVVKELLRTCKEVFARGGAGIVPHAKDVERLRSVLDGMQPADVGLSPAMPYFKTVETEGAPPITYLHLYECNKFSIGIFCLPPSAVIPLHNHPGMTVFSKLLFGTMHIKSYDWVTDVPHSTNQNPNPSNCQPTGIRLAKIKTDSDFTAPCNTSILYPAAGGNMHCFTAITSCAVLDVLGPPYSDPEGRHCTYYRDFQYTSFSGDAELVPEEEREGYAWLEEREKKPDDLNVVGAMYTGPKIVGN
ncbi:PREDICTED: plant cysteine oxidase 2 isoform X2 [Nelumbo nucifera]|uniref:cysteine dioxygenase n=1 Tax=Nelumbo nucifera TaxID=4432 RepID=A0A1U7YQL9_NELNU|nr:PREDICTED: plant cysteine oxidase 2 isoform X2 [Nelumbo nucifera]